MPTKQMTRAPQWLIVFTIEDRDGLRIDSSRWRRPTTECRRCCSRLACTRRRDRWSDLDIMFAVKEDASVTAVLEAWSTALVREFAGVRLFDLVSGPITYRVFLLPNALELDLSFAPASHFGAGGPKFKLLFGESSELPENPPRPHTNSSAMPSIMRCTHERPSSEVGTGRRNIGSARCVTTHSVLLVGVAGSMAVRQGLRRAARRSLAETQRCYVRSLERDELRRALRKPWRRSSLNRPRPAIWLRRLGLNCELV